MTRRVRLWILAVCGGGLAVLLVAACLELPGFGGDQHPYGDRAVRESLARQTANTVSSVIFDQRAFDTLGEMTILFSAVLGTVVLLRQTREEHRAHPAPAQVAVPVRRYALLTLPVALLTGLYVIAHGQLSPGGGFQGGVVAATALHLLYLGADYRALERIRPVGLYEVGDALAASAYLVLGLAGVLAGTAFLADTLLPYGTFVHADVRRDGRTRRVRGLAGVRGRLRGPGRHPGGGPSACAAGAGRADRGGRRGDVLVPAAHQTPAGVLDGRPHRAVPHRRRGVLTPASDGGVALYILGHAGVKAALFACAGIVLDRFGSVDEYALHGRARELRGVAVLFVVGAPGLAGLPPFGTALGKALTEEAAGPALTVLYVAVSTVTAAAVLRVAARVFLGLGPKPEEHASYETTGAGEPPETRRRLRRVPDTMTTVPTVLLGASFTAGVAPGFATVVDHAVNEAGAAAAFASPHWTPAGVLLGLTSTLPAVGLAGLAVTRRTWLPGEAWAGPLRRLQSGHIGDYVAWLLAGAALLGGLALPGIHTG